MSIRDLCCDRCGLMLLPPGAADPTGAPLGTPTGAVRFNYDPGNPHLRDSSGLCCPPCWTALAQGWPDPAPPGRCASCAGAVSRFDSLHVSGSRLARAVQLCRTHAIVFLNQLRTVEPKLDPQDFAFPPAPASTEPDD